MVFMLPTTTTAIIETPDTTAQSTAIMRTTIILMATSLLGALAAPAAEPAELEARAYSCTIANDTCYISCRAGSSTINCAASYVSDLGCGLLGAG
jgi:hypothetical protein